MKQNNEKFNNAMHKFVGVLDKYAFVYLLLTNVNRFTYLV